ncbi:MAG: TonB-dependent receptor [Candidatus Andeanibacterium colombiense]|uniref:TonB-dependent receptor n=1 Tax=Candidatus Andeanibacterium colombiense TaxID=3121345 RepID=A0AAJ5X4Q1_9SPHN|nr:MAG: TonB-dependent receptor [Sphingomonadaceae bacterium]
MKLRLLASACLLTYLPAVAHAEDAASETADNAFTLGQIVVTSDRVPASEVTIGSNTLDQKAMEAFQTTALDDAVNMIPGVVASNSGGSRNERLIFVRGFDRFQVPLSIDGIRVYLPADNRLDFGRFLTPDIAEVQVAKGYASVLDGPGGMGGEINLVTRKPTQTIEAEARGTLELDRSLDYAAYTVFGLLGTRQDQWYAQASFARSYRDHWKLPASFTPTVNEDGGDRGFSDTADWRVNAKIGWTPNATDEYSVSYTRQEGSKEAPIHLTSTVNSVRRYWTWPEWNIESLYFLSSTALSDALTLKTRAYKSNYYNMLRSFDSAAENTQTTPRSFDSPYSDTAAGGSAELDFKAGERDRLSLAVHYRRDEHNEKQLSQPDLPASTYEPNQESLENNYSVALENQFDISGSLKFTLGASYDWRDLVKAEEYNSTTKLIYSFPLKDAHGWNAQGRLDWTGADGTSAYASISSRIRFPTLFERFSSQFGTADPNPELEPERATNFEVGGAKQFGLVRASGAVFYSLLHNALVSIRTAGNLNRRENIGSADYYGAEIALDAQLTPSLSAGVNFSYTHRSFDVGDAPIGGFIREFRLTDVPAHKGMAWIQWEPVKRFTIMPSAEFTSDRMTVDPATANNDAPNYYKLDGYVNVALRADYRITERIKFGVGVKNLFDEYYELTDGFPEPGRSFFATVQAKY